MVGHISMMAVVPCLFGFDGWFTNHADKESMIIIRGGRRNKDHLFFGLWIFRGNLLPNHFVACVETKYALTIIVKSSNSPFPDCCGSCHDNDDNDKIIIEYLITSICTIGQEMPPSDNLLRPWLDAFLIIPPQCRVVHVAWGQKSPHSTSAYHCEGPRNQSCDHKVLRSCPPH